MFDILVAGEINPDLILSDSELSIAFGQQESLVERANLTIGSSSAIFSCGAARLGLKVGFIGVVGQDLFGLFMLEAMQARGVDTTPVIVDPQIQTGLSVILSRGADRAILTYPGAMVALTAGQVTDHLLRQSRHLHVASYFLQTALQPGLPSLFERAHSLGLTISLDPNWDPSGRWSGFQELLRSVDVFFPNRAEALAITGQGDLDFALDRLSRWCPVITVKLGAQGGIARRGDETASAPAIAGPVVDTVGAGDSFDGGFLYGYLNNWSLEDSIRLACACGSLSTRQPGGTTGQPTLEEALQALEKA